MKVKNILISQPTPETEKNPYSELAQKYNVHFEFRQFIKIEGVSAKELRKERVNFLDFTAVIFTSKTAIDHYFRLCEEMRVTVPETMRYLCMSESVALYLQKYIVYRKRKIAFGNGKFDDLIKLIQKYKTESFLVPLSDIHNQEIPNKLAKENVQFRSVVLYRTVSNDVKDIDISFYDTIVFFSPGGIKSLFENFPGFVQGEKYIGGFGSTTHAAIKEAGLRLDIMAPRPEAPSMIMALDQFLSEVKKKK
ncbi:MAG TPA: uroporphyrinogen-III synthase [Salinivirgaceae bacterium]|nr:uroporphyrinogen-III synthase [Salinivirgaceae bacterium]